MLKFVVLFVLVVAAVAKNIYSGEDAPSVLAFGVGCSWRPKTFSNSCWRYCDPKTPTEGPWCWTSTKCGKGFMGFQKGKCPATVASEKCAGKCGEIGLGPFSNDE